MSLAWDVRAGTASLPEGWQVRRIGDLVSLVNGHPFPSDSFGPSGEVPLVRIRDLLNPKFETFVSGFIPSTVMLQHGDVVVGMDGDFNVAVWRRGPAALNQRLCLLRPLAGVDIRFIAYSLPASLKIINDLTFSTTVKHLSSSEILRERLMLPPLGEQRRIADFLDHEATKTHPLTMARRAQISSLSELELARVADTLSGKGEEGGRVPTGWQWLPSIPDRWTVGPVYGYFDVALGKMLNAERAAGDDAKLYLRNANVHWYEVDIRDLARMTFEPDERRRYGVLPGDLLVCEGGAGVAEAAVWDGRISECYYQKSLHRVRARRDVPVEWLMYWLRYAKATGVFEADGNLATIPHLTGEQLSEYRIPIPPDGAERVKRLASQIAIIRQLQADLASANSLLAERRQALISAAVTGQIDVTTARGVDV